MLPANKWRTNIMSWLSKKTGRPKEQGGHHRIDITVNESTYNILSIPDNRSRYIESCVNTCTETKWTAFHEPSETVNDYFTTFKTASTSIWIPDNSVHNGIISTLVTFQHKCSGKSFMVRMKLNGNVTSSIEVKGNETWCGSQVYIQKDFTGENELRKNQDSYIFEFQFEPYGLSDRVYVRDISMFLEVVDGLRFHGTLPLLD